MESDPIPPNLRIGEHLKKARKAAAKLKNPIIAHLLDMAILDVYGEEKKQAEPEQKGKPPIPNGF